MNNPEDLAKQHEQEILRGIEECDAGLTIPHAEVVAWAESLGTENPLPRPLRKARRVGFVAGQLSVPDDFDEMGSAEIEDMFYGEEETPKQKKPSDRRDFRQVQRALVLGVQLLEIAEEVVETHVVLGLLDRIKRSIFGLPGVCLHLEHSRSDGPD